MGTTLNTGQKKETDTDYLHLRPELLNRIV